MPLVVYMYILVELPTMYFTYMHVHTHYTELYRVVVQLSV